MTDRIGSVVFGPNWDKPTAVGASDGGTFIAQPVYRHEIAKLMEIIAKLEARIASLEARPTNPNWPFGGGEAAVGIPRIGG